MDKLRGKHQANTLRLCLRKNLAKGLQGSGVRMADCHCLSLFAGASQSKLELFADRACLGDVVEERNVAESRRNAKILRCLVRHGSGGGAAVDIE